MFNNPYAQGGWANTANPNAGTSGTVPQPSILGALPYPSRVRDSSSETFLSFRFTSFRPNILNSSVVGPQNRTYFRVQTDVPTVGFTIIHNSANQPMIIIEWLKHPVIEIREIVSKRQTSQWLALSPDKRRAFYRTMTAKGKTCVWAPDGKYICLYAVGLGAPQTYARVFHDEDEVALEISAEAIQIGLLEVCVAAALLLQSGRKID
ncbi:hypothetical protein C8R43DRAFT_1202685 [Mycena crocata]|nr:hypothetical protein C8R43DRAFT_1202685 [Mycena crocata]